VGVKQPELFAGLTLVLAVLFVGFLAGDLFARDHWLNRKAVAT
jgi:hypothetical protein